MSKGKRARSIVGDSEGRPEDDFYPTPPGATFALLRVEQFHSVIWEPACGDGSMSKVLIEKGYEVLSTDKNDHGYGTPYVDFLREPLLSNKSMSIVTNPPFVLCNQFIEHAHKLKAQKFAFFLKLSALEGIERSAIMQRTGLARVHVFSNRVQLTRNGAPMENGGMMAFAWFVWEHGFQGDPTLHWITYYEQDMLF